MKKQKLMLGNNIELLKKIPDNSIDSVVTDPPYGLSFMGKKWDYDVPTIEFWYQVYRVLKPGGHILAFGGTRTYHRLAVNIEDAGFEIRDQIQWLYGSGFPKSLNVGKAIDKLEGNERETIGENPNHRKTSGLLELGFQDGKENSYKTKGQTEWEGWGSALKPANEPICLARKPLSEKSIAENVLKWKTGGLNIDGCRIESPDNNGKIWVRGGNGVKAASGSKSAQENPRLNNETKHIKPNQEGRFPANLILDETAAEMLDEQSGVSKSSDNKWEADNNYNIFYNTSKKILRQSTYSDKGGASRFFYVAKVSKAERNMGLDGFEDKSPSSYKFAEDDSFIENKTSKSGIQIRLPRKNNHPTVKPVNLMSYLCKLITPPNGIVLDPFMGSGSTGIAALLNDFRFVGMEMDSDYFKIAEARINDFESYRKLLKK